MEEEGNEDSTSQVFRNRVILREVFKYLPTSALISSCSLVNRLWREEARSFIRDYRECTVKVGVKSSTTIDQSTNLWKHLCELDRMLGKMDIIPFNSLHVVITKSNIRWQEKAGKKTLTNLMSRFPLKYLSVFEENGLCLIGAPSCPVALSIFELIEGNCSTLLEFEIRSDLSPFGVFRGWQPPERFDSLKKLSVARNSSVRSSCVKKIIRGASNLTAIHNNCLHMIPDVIPENMYGTLKRLVFRVVDVNRIEQFVDKLDQLEELLLDIWTSNESAKVRCVALFHKLLTLNIFTLRSLGVRCHDDATLLNQLQLPLLPSVKELSISVSSTFGFLTHISALNFRGSLPNLRQVHIREENKVVAYYNDANTGIVPEEDVIVAPNASKTTLEVTIEGRVGTSDLVTLGRLFPNVIVLKLSFPCQMRFPPLGWIGIIWPNLQSLSIFSLWLQDKVGAEVLGLNPEEWRLLRQQDQQFFKCVQLVPSRPCILTMRELRHFQLEYRYRSYPGGPPQAEKKFRQFLEPLVIGRRPGSSFIMKEVWTDPSWGTRRFRDLFQEKIF